MILDHFHAFDEAPDITSQAEYEKAKALYAVMDAAVPGGDLHSPVARYLISLGGRIAAWEDQAAAFLSSTSDLPSSP